MIWKYGFSHCEIGNRKLTNLPCKSHLGDCCVETWYGDGYCDYANRHVKCGNFDGGDCDEKYPDCYKAKLIGNGECDESNLEQE